MNTCVRRPLRRTSSGSIVLKALPWKGLPSEAKRYWIVDGQQRAITLTLIAAAIRDRIARLSGSDEDRVAVSRAYTDQLFRNASLKEDHQARLVLQEQDASALTPIVNGPASALSDAPIDRAYAYFTQQLQALSKEELEDVLSILLVRMTAVWVVLEEDDNAHRVFQTLNAGGKPLRQADLVRNYFFLLLGEAGDDFYHTHWKLLEADLPARELEEYFVAWSITQGHTGAKQSLFRYFQSDVSSEEEDEDAVLSYGRRLTSTARQFQWIRNPEDSPLVEAKATLTELRGWGTLPAEGLILHLLRRYADGDLSDDNLAQSLEFVVSFMARRMLAGFEPQLHKDIFVRSAHRLRVRSDLTQEGIVSYLRYTLSRGADVRSWPSTELVVARATSNSLYTRPRGHWVASILQRSNAELANKGDVVVSMPAGPPVEVHHIMPEALTPAWADDLEAWGVDHVSGMHQSRVHVLGNLALVTGDVRSDLSFDDKRVAFDELGFPVNKGVISRTMWVSQEIDQRSIELARVACGTYPEPLDREAQASSPFNDLRDDESFADAVELEEDA